MTGVSVIFFIVAYISVLHGNSQASIYEVLGKNLSSHLREGLENTGSATRQSGTGREWHKGDDYFTQYRDSHQQGKSSRNNNGGIYSMQKESGIRGGSGSSSFDNEHQHWDSLKSK